MRDSGDWFHAPLWDAWYLTGPTASGKSELALCLAESIDAEIVSMDSMAVYRHMDIGTAKPTSEQRSRKPHHLIDLVDPNEDFSLSCYIRAAHATAREIKNRGKQVLFVGGTPLYLKSLLRGMFQGPPADREFRKQVEEDVERFGAEELRKRLWQVDPLSAHKLHPNDVRRMIRALEVSHILGRPLSHLQAQFESSQPFDRLRVFVLGWERSCLHQRINERVDKMFDAGLVEESQRLLTSFGQLVGTAKQAVGYREVFRYLQEGLDLATTMEEVKAHTRQFARRQEIWFRSMSECRRLEVTSSTSISQLANQIESSGASVILPSPRD
ncbi:MAG: tRNA dimethylallyltransferase [Planctomycetota bacterium]|jgi:tRNA dimethylallyltransferase